MKNINNFYLSYDAGKPKKVWYMSPHNASSDMQEIDIDKDLKSLYDNTEEIQFSKAAENKARIILGR